jgi:DNA-binding response OmpR family regulator
MRGEIIIICEKESFMTNSIKKNLEIASFEVSVCGPDPAQLEEMSEDLPDDAFFLLFLWDNIERDTEFLSALHKTVLECTIKLFVVGNPGDKQAISEYVPESQIIKFFERPLNVGQLTTGIIEETELLSYEQFRKKILVVDDDPLMLRTIKGWLEVDYTVVVVNSAMNALTWLAKNDADLILLDYEMPIVSGAKMLEMLRKEPASMNVPVIFLTGKGDKKSVLEVLKYNPDGYLLKSLAPFEIKNAIKEFFDRHCEEDKEDNDIFWNFVNKMSNMSDSNEDN